MSESSRPQVSRPQVRDILHIAKPRKVKLNDATPMRHVWYARADCHWYAKSHPEAGIISATLAAAMQRLANAGALQGYIEPPAGNGGIWFERWADAMAALTKAIIEVEALQAI